MATSNFKVFNENKQNIMNDADYENSGYRQNGCVSGVAPSNIHNKLYRQTSMMAAGIAQVLADRGIEVMDEDFEDLLDSLSHIVTDEKFAPTTGHKHTGAEGDAPQLTSTGLAAGAATDAIIGNRTVNQALATPGNTGTLTQLLSWIVGRIRAITGATNWYDTPAATLAQLWALFGVSGHSHNGTAGQGPKIAYSNLSGVPSAFTPTAHTHDDRYYTESEVDSLLAADTGKIIFFARNTPPAGYLKANGSAVSRTTYAALFAAIGTVFGAGNGSTTFNLPDMRGEFVRSWDDGRGVDSGRAFGSYQKGSIHTIDTGPAIAVVGERSNSTGAAAVLDDLGYDPATLAEYPNARELNTGPSGGGPVNVSAEGVPGVTRPRNIALLACIKY